MIFFMLHCIPAGILWGIAKFFYYNGYESEHNFFIAPYKHFDATMNSIRIFMKKEWRTLVFVFLALMGIDALREGLYRISEKIGESLYELKNSLHKSVKKGCRDVAGTIEEFSCEISSIDANIDMLAEKIVFEESEKGEK
jgi:hypothetical protein